MVQTCKRACGTDRTFETFETLETCCDLGDWLKPEVFKALADPNRLSIMASLAEGKKEQSVKEVAQCCSVDLSVVSRHLGTLRRAGVVESEKRGKEVFYRVRIDELVRLLRGLADALEACCPDGHCTIESEDARDER